MATSNPLQNLIPARARKSVYGLVALASLVFAAWEASEGNVEVFVGGLISALVSALALSNVDSASPVDESYEDGHGGA